ncbi:hypothetical protein TVAG_153290 [Trichomonas vaginalis G3]|uniref:Uncharacterized protein n=1 Tax=Trichomonas vaginalis (strain ATCC PRA-98 / G3) TaxID=412133 RepID=A2FYY3_TRIV3|nr:hypothetical protein TVAGG3_0521170 [Trichomonas vaginalis G3]EAX89884.1 hypothetical protein TVAG_153290 [Trichomonas vaginalis G3]KAI5518460.1 hypothetical protein TVAGG3_0521170 [Trichomonas vaginalis G3]|eukprot:XP_001302814.1 hypothetical protein [Trichomonas vaginalis G3]
MIDDVQAPGYSITEIPQVLQKWAVIEDSVIDVTVDSAAATAIKIKESGLIFKKYIPNLFEYAIEIHRFN